ncbi:hypothetical protein [Sphingomonas sp. BK235]|uniref:hypothetical protein n=1 Tax=Sphingomonas sp. BK235 TaxID=2512131 RepID=UPI0010482840|nr:hypothetical protein [Sphingomonas sp. BK235]TCP33248.1 hypothetical protein EV292_106190 [Sphingomonas sp. BK235]
MSRGRTQRRVPARAAQAQARPSVTALMAIAGLLMGLTFCEGAALLGAGPHVTIIFGGQG